MLEFLSYLRIKHYNVSFGKIKMVLMLGRHFVRYIRLVRYRSHIAERVDANQIDA